MSEPKPEASDACLHGRVPGPFGCVDCERDDLHGRVTRTLKYADDLLAVDELDATLRIVLRAVRGSLTTPATKHAGASNPEVDSG